MQYSGYLTTLQSQGSATCLAIFTLRFFPLSDPSDCLLDWPEPRGVDTTSASTGRGHSNASGGFSNFRGVFRMEFSSNTSGSSDSPANSSTTGKSTTTITICVDSIHFEKPVFAIHYLRSLMACWFALLVCAVSCRLTVRVMVMDLRNPLFD